MDEDLRQRIKENIRLNRLKRSPLAVREIEIKKIQEQITKKTDRDTKKALKNKIKIIESFSDVEAEKTNNFE